MGNVWLVARQEFRRVAMRRGYLLGALAVPLALALVIGLVILVETLNADDRPVGFVDSTGMLDTGRQAAGEDVLRVIRFGDEAAARAALVAGEVQAVFVFPELYPADLHVQLLYQRRPPDSSVWRDFDDFVRRNLLADQPEERRRIVMEELDVTIHDPDSGRSLSERNLINVIVPLLVSFFFFVATLTTSGYMLQIVADEKENRTMEIMVTSIGPGQLIWGKALGLLVAALLQIAIYAATLVIGVVIAAPHSEVIRLVVVPWGFLTLVLAFFLPSFALLAALMVAIGGAVTELQQGQQVAGLLNFLFIAPLFALYLLIQNPGHPLIVAMTLFPTTSLLTVAMRWGLSAIPTWQLVLSWLLLVLSAGAAMGGAARVFRAGMLRYGQPLSVRGVLAALRGG